MTLALMLTRVAAAAAGRADTPIGGRLRTALVARAWRFTLVGLLLLSVAWHLSAAPRRRWADGASVRRSSIRNRRASRGWPPAVSTASRSRCFRWAATSARRSVRSSRRSSSCRGASRASPGARCWRSLRSSCSWPDRPLAPAPHRSQTAGSAAPPHGVPPRDAFARRVAWSLAHPGGADLLEVLLPREPEHLLTPSI